MTGKDKGKQGRVMLVFASENKVLVEGVNYVKKAKRRTSQEQQHTGIVQMEKPLSISNVAVVCKNCNAAAKVGFSILKDKTKTRICKKCNEAIQ
ncbi:MAG TPA: 50S ribosomal protein L24 [Candidatus Omnitrophota bacterium]|nr:50S ribosomal protein L24 [Candidatus Omnitrophota bacterium]